MIKLSILASLAFAAFVAANDPMVIGYRTVGKVP
jgi:hypothetical protein